MWEKLWNGTSPEAVVKSWRDGEEPGATSSRMLKIVLLWMSGRVQDKRRERTRLTSEGEEVEEAGGLRIKSYTEGKAEEGWLEKFQGRRVCSKGAGAQSCLRCLQEGGGAEVRTGERIVGKSGYFPVFSVSKKKLKKPEIKPLHTTASM